MSFSIEQGSIVQYLPILLNFNNNAPLVITSSERAIMIKNFFSGAAFANAIKSVKNSGFGLWFLVALAVCVNFDGAQTNYKIPIGSQIKSNIAPFYASNQGFFFRISFGFTLKPVKVSFINVNNPSNNVVFQRFADGSGTTIFNNTSTVNFNLFTSSINEIIYDGYNILTNRYSNSYFSGLIPGQFTGIGSLQITVESTSADLTGDGILVFYDKNNFNYAWTLNNGATRSGILYTIPPGGSILYNVGLLNSQPRNAYTNLYFNAPTHVNNHFTYTFLDTQTPNRVVIDFVVSDGSIKITQIVAGVSTDYTVPDYNWKTSSITTYVAHQPAFDAPKFQLFNALDINGTPIYEITGLININFPTAVIAAGALNPSSDVMSNPTQYRA